MEEHIMSGLLERTDAEATQSCERIKACIDDLISQVREDIIKTNDPRARALFETTAEVLGGLKTAYVHYEAGIEPGFPAHFTEQGGTAPTMPTQKSADPHDSAGPASLGES
jgi:hypothetical protein